VVAGPAFALLRCIPPSAFTCLNCVEIDLQIFQHRLPATPSICPFLFAFSTLVFSPSDRILPACFLCCLLPSALPAPQLAERFLTPLVGLSLPTHDARARPPMGRSVYISSSYVSPGLFIRILRPSALNVFVSTCSAWKRCSAAAGIRFTFPFFSALNWCPRWGGQEKYLRIRPETDSVLSIGSLIEVRFYVRLFLCMHGLPFLFISLSGYVGRVPFASHKALVSIHAPVFRVPAYDRPRRSNCAA